MLFVLCYPRFEAPVAERIETFRRRHEPARAALVQAHVTLVFGTRAAGFAELAARCEDAARNIPAFRIGCAEAVPHIDETRGEYNLFLRIGTGRETLDTLHRRLYRGAMLSELRPDLPFDPHITIASAVSASALETTLADTDTLGLPAAGRIEALLIARLNGDERSGGRLKPLASIALSSIAPASIAPD